jgi:hypothetical protein
MFDFDERKEAASKHATGASRKRFEMGRHKERFDVARLALYPESVRAMHICDSASCPSAFVYAETTVTIPVIA